jgi:radical SAM protein with 4Fe4S-binding SPASM domain
MNAIAELPVLVLFPHNRCNCRCVMCDIWRIRQVRQITCDDLRPHLDSIRRLQVRWVVFSGGEPQLNAGLPELARMLRQEGIRITLLTAGLLLEKHAAEVITFVDDIIVSLDGPSGLHDRIRNVPDAFARLARGIAAVRVLRPDFEISARTTVQKANFKYLRQAVETARSLGLNSISFLAADLTSSAFNRSEPWDSARQHEIALTAGELEELEDEVEALIDECAADISGGFIREDALKLRRLVSHFAAHLGLAEAVAPHCNAPWVSAVVEADGEVRPCFFQPAIGNIGEQPLFEILNGPRAMEFRETLDIPRNPICRRCVCSLYVPAGANAVVTASKGRLSFDTVGTRENA